MHSKVLCYWTGLVTVLESYFSNQLNIIFFYSYWYKSIHTQKLARSINEIFEAQLGRPQIYIRMKFSFKYVQSSWHKCRSQSLRSTLQHKQITRVTATAIITITKKGFSPKPTKEKLVEDRKGLKLYWEKYLQRKKEATNRTEKKEKKTRVHRNK